jgi:hypothetical protein
VDLDPLGRFMGDWVTWAQRVTVRRLREDVNWAVTLQDIDPGAFLRTGALPADREIRSWMPNPTPVGDGTSSATGPERPAVRTAKEPCTVRIVGAPDVVQLLRAVLCTVRRRMETIDGQLPSEGQALGVMLDHALACWGIGGKVPSEHRVFDRDGWLCRVPGCTSMENLQNHHIRFRSRGGSDEPPNRVSLCAFHHLRGIHAERIRCTGRAPDGLRWEIGTRPGKAPLAVYGSGDVEIAGGAN